MRISDVGVVFDLATHDIDLISWLCGPFQTMHSISQSVVNGPHEDLIKVVGLLESGVVATMSVNWVSPAKERRLTVTGTREAFLADLLAADPTFHENGNVPTEWDEINRLLGVTEGNRTTFALRNGSRSSLNSRLSVIPSWVTARRPLSPLLTASRCWRWLRSCLGP